MTTTVSSEGQINRRRWLKQASLAASAGVWPSLAFPRRARAAEPRPTQPQEQAMAEVALGFMRRFRVPGLSVAVARHGQMVCQAAYGFADKDRGEQAAPRHRWRIASMTKPITSTAIFTLIEKGRLKLTDRVFGVDGLLKYESEASTRALVEQITVHQLLTHTSGGWENDADDPMFLHPGMNHAALIAWTLRHQPLKNPPGQSFAYSNFGYCLLGRIIESISRQTYQDYVKAAVLAPCGVRSMEIAGNTLAERAPGEVIYYSDGAGDPYGMNVRRMDSHGGWIATPSDYVTFLLHVDGFASTPNLLRRETITAMTAPTPANAHYACGWAVNAAPNWWHAGSLPGASTIGVRTGSGLCWAAFTNARAEGIGPALDEMMWHFVRAVPEWQA